MAVVSGRGGGAGKEHPDKNWPSTKKRSSLRTRPTTRAPHSKQRSKDWGNQGTAPGSQRVFPKNT